MRPRWSGHRGLSLGEVLVASALLSLLVVSLANLFPSVVVALRSSDQQQQAYALAQDGLEAAAARPFASLALGPLPLPEIPARGVHTLAVTVSAVSGYPPEHLKRVTATVSWTARSGPRTIIQEVDLHPARP